MRFTERTRSVTSSPGSAAMNSPRGHASVSVARVAEVFDRGYHSEWNQDGYQGQR